MTPRPYRLGERAASVEETRRRVVAAAAAAFAEQGFHRVSLDGVAREADVARATVYHRFGSKLGLLDAVISDFEQRAGLAGLVDLIDTTPEPQLLPVVIAAGCRYWSTDPPLVRTIIATATEAGAMKLLGRHDAGRRRLLGRMVTRLDAAELLGPGCDRGHAVDVLWLVTGFPAYDELTRGRRRSARSAARTLTRIAEAQLIAGG